MAKKCIVCGKETLEFLQDFDAEDCGMTESGWISEYICKNCQSEYDIFIPKSAADKIDEDGEHGTLI